MFFMEEAFQPMPEEENHNWCGGTGLMICFDPEGKAYPCLRYMKSSLGDSREPICVGDCKNGIYNTQKSLKIKDNLKSITRRS
jgi:uncharacterized protein